MKRVVALLICLASFPSYAAAYEEAGWKIRGVYVGSNSIGVHERIEKIYRLLEKGLINTVVVDKKDDDGREFTGERFQNAIAGFRNRGARIICRVVTLKDNQYHNTHPEFFLKSIQNPGRIWTDYQGSQFLDPASPGTAQYIITVSIRAIRDGCDMINFDYIRLPSGLDGNTRDTKYPPTGAMAPVKRAAMWHFLEILVTEIKKESPTFPYAASLFGYAFHEGEPGIGQYLEDFARLGFILSPMAYPTHYACGDGAPDPSFIPYKIYRRTLEAGLRYLAAKKVPVEIQPWLQAFSIYNICRYIGKGTCKENCGIQKAEYDKKYVQEEIHALRDIQADLASGKLPGGSKITGWLMWNPGTRYPEEIFQK